jgi:DNA-binding LacI/PurR family transcriptional regulator
MSSALVAGHVAACGYKRIGMLSGPLSIFAAKLRRAEFIANLAQGEEVVWRCSSLSIRTSTRPRERRSAQ